MLWGRGHQENRQCTNGKQVSKERNTKKLEAMVSERRGKKEKTERYTNGGRTLFGVEGILRTDKALPHLFSQCGCLEEFCAGGATAPFKNSRPTPPMCLLTHGHDGWTSPLGKASGWDDRLDDSFIAKAEGLFRYAVAVHGVRGCWLRMAGAQNPQYWSYSTGELYLYLV
jgi:hypothetical protein